MIYSNATTKSFEANEADIAAINQFTRRSFGKDELYTFSLILCDNEVDRDYERFDTEALHQLATLFVGKTGVFDHNPKGENQTARVFETAIMVDEARVTSYGEPYTYLFAKAYMVKAGKNADLMLDIDAGIKKEVSISCSVKTTLCSICGKNAASDSCSHVKGKSYGGKLCHHILSSATDAYEWSFVAVPAQRNAGVTKSFVRFNEADCHKLIKSFGECEGELTVTRSEARALSAFVNDLAEKAETGLCYLEDMRCEIKKLSYLAKEELPHEVLSSVVDKMDLHELKAYKLAYEKQLCDEIAPQLAPNVAQTADTSNQFKIDIKR